MQESLAPKGFALGRGAQSGSGVYNIYVTFAPGGNSVGGGAAITVSAAGSGSGFFAAPLGNVALTGGGAVAELISDMTSAKGTDNQDTAVKTAYQAKYDPALMAKTAAAYKDYTVTMADVEYTKALSAAGNTEMTDRDAVRQLVTDCIVTDEAISKGYAATDAEIEEAVESTRASYDVPEGRQCIDNCLALSGQTFDEYLESLRQSAPSMLTRNKLRRAYIEDYCRKNGVKYQNDTAYSAEMETVWNTYCQSLYNAHSSEVQYFAG
jgi:hypothetical protein